MKLSEKKKSVAGKMSPTHSIMGTKYPKGVSASKDRMYNIKAYQKGRESLNPPHKGRDNEVMEGKGEKELS